MLRRLELGFVAAASLVACFAANADVYKYTDAKGNVEYTDKPHALPAERLNIQSQKGEQANAQTPPAPKPQETPAAPVDSQPKKKEISPEDKEERCKKARERYDSFMNSPRLYQDLGNGERRYLSDQELDSARTFAKTTMDTLCK
jgi:hypothetical protein